MIYLFTQKLEDIEAYKHFFIENNIIYDAEYMNRHECIKSLRNNQIVLYKNSIYTNKLIKIKEGFISISDVDVYDIEKDINIKIITSNDCRDIIMNSIESIIFKDL